MQTSDPFYSYNNPKTVKFKIQHPHSHEYKNQTPNQQTYTFAPAIFTSRDKSKLTRDSQRERTGQG